MQLSTLEETPQVTPAVYKTVTGSVLVSSLVSVKAALSTRFIGQDSSLELAKPSVAMVHV